MINENEVRTTPTSQRILDVIGKLLRGLGRVLGWVIEEVEITFRLFGVSPMLAEFGLAAAFTLIYFFPSEETMGSIARVGTELAIPFLLGIIYSALNMIEVTRRRGQDARWYWAVVKVLSIPVLNYLIFANRPFQRFVGWGDPAATFRFCLFLVWGVVVANAVIVNASER